MTCASTTSARRCALALRGAFLTLIFSRKRRPVKVFVILIEIIENHQSGRDSHVRQLRVFGPMQNVVDPILGEFANIELASHATVR